MGRWRGGALVGSAVSGGSAGGTQAGAAIGATSGAMIGAAAAPQPTYAGGSPPRGCTQWANDFNGTRICTAFYSRLGFKPKSGQGHRKRHRYETHSPTNVCRRGGRSRPLRFRFRHYRRRTERSAAYAAELVQRWAEAALDAQLKGIKTSLRLTDDQEKDWAPFETAVKDGEKARVLALQKEQGNNLSPMGRLNAKAERLAQSQADLEKIVEAAKPLYASLSDAQKHKFIALGRMLVPERGRFAMEMRHLRVGEGDRHVALAAIGGKSAPSEAASTPATATAGTNGAK